MKKLIAISLVFASSSLFAISNQTLNMLRSRDVNQAQNARMLSEKSSEAQDILISTLKLEQDPLLADGIIYSLGSIQSKKAYTQILEIAKSGNTAAILALSKYGNKALGDLEILAEEYPVAKNALVLAQDLPKPIEIPTAKHFSTLSEKEQFKLLANLPRKKSCMRFLENINYPYPLVIMNTYAKLGDNGAADKIMELQEKYNLDISQDSPALNILSSCRRAELSLTTASLQGNIYAIRALKNQRLAYAEAILIALSKDSNEAIKLEAIDALSTCGSDKAAKAFLQVLPKAKKEYLDLYVKSSIAIYKALNEQKQAELKSILHKKISSSKGENKIAMTEIMKSFTGEN